MHVSLTPEQGRFVAEAVESGRYNSATEVLKEALHLLEDRDHVRSSRKAAFDQELRERVASLDRGEHVEPTAARVKMQRRSGKRKQVSA